MQNGLNAAIFKDPYNTKKDLTKAKDKSVKIQYSCDNFNLKFLSLSSAVNLSLCNNPEIGASWNSLLASQESLGVGYSQYMPQLKASTGYTYFDSDINLINSSTSSIVAANNGGNSVTSVSLTYLLYDFGKRGNEIKSLKNALMSSGFAYNEKLQDVVLRTNRLYYAYFSAQKMLESKIKLENLAKRSMEFAEKRKIAGRGTKLDILQSKSSYQNAKSQRIRAEKEADMSRINLFLHIGINPKLKIEVKNPIAQDSSLIDKMLSNDVDTLLEISSRSNSSLQQAYFDFKKAKSDLKVEKAGYYPSISANAGGYRVESVGAGSGVNRSIKSNYAGISIGMNLFSGFETDYEIRVKERQMEVAKARLDATKLEVQRYVWQSYFDFENSKESLIASKEYLESAIEAENFASSGYKAGVVNIIDLLSAQSNLASAEEGYIVSIFNKEIAKISLLKAIGELGV